MQDSRATRPCLPAAWWLLVLALTAGCTGARSLLPGLAPSPREEYASSLSEAGLDTSTLGVAWLRAGDRALAAPVDSALPFRETGYFAAGDPDAVAYRMNLARGRVLVVEVGFASTEAGRLFVDLFRERPGNADGPERIASLSAEATSLRAEIDEDGAYLLRLQPELLRSGRYTVVQRTEASLGVFPVSGHTASAVRSGFSAPRDGGLRSHEGIDIFAARGTPVVAVVDGTAQPSSNTLGGTVVWLRSEGRRFYYAHLDRTAFPSSKRVQAGEVIGYVGNSGNARTTDPHLHFGIYARRPVDPLPFVEVSDRTPPDVALPLELLGEWKRSARPTTALRGGNGPRANQIASLERHTVFEVRAASAESYRVELPDGVGGYVMGSSVEALDPPVGSRRLDTLTQLVDAPAASAVPMTALPAGASVAVLGRHATYRLVRAEDGTKGWIANTAVAVAER